jgi:site-specific DNA-methyltransferase (adenine-specific)
MALSRLACTHAHETLIWAFECERHILTYDLINGPDPASQVSSVWRIPTAPGAEKHMDRHPTQKPLRLVRRALLATTREGALVFDPFCGSGITAVVAKELGRFFIGEELERGFAELAGRRVGATERGSVLRAQDLGDAEGSSRR